jgi:glucose 1-dehydrogenase
MERVALVTGASTGIGWAVAERLHRDGFALAFHSHHEEDEDRERFEEIVRRGRAHWVVGDVSDPGTDERLVRHTVDALGGLDVLVNNAGVTSAKPALELGPDDFDKIFGVDVKGAFFLAVAAAREMRGRGGGSIVNVTSVHEHVARPGFALYSAAKAALGMITRSLAVELAADGIRVNAVAPGAIAVERSHEPQEFLREIPLGRTGTPEEVAALVSYLVSDEAAYVTGASILIDGGLAQQVVTQPAF